MDLEVTHHVHTALTDDHREAAQAFMDKREPASEAGDLYGSIFAIADVNNRAWLA